MEQYTMLEYQLFASHDILYACKVYGLIYQIDQENHCSIKQELPVWKCLVPGNQEATAADDQPRQLIDDILDPVRSQSESGKRSL
jgi:hypothetical protein